MLQGFHDLLSGAGEPILLSLAVGGVLFIGGGILFLLLSGGVHFAGFHPPDPTSFPNASKYLRRIGTVLIALGVPAIVIPAFLAWWDAGSVEPLSDDLRASRAELDKLSQEAHEKELQIAALNQKLIQERNNTQKIESQLSEAEIGLAQSRQELADAQDNIEAEYTNRIDELSQTVDALKKTLDALKKKEASTEQKSLALGSENQELAGDNESLRADLEASEKKITELEMALADAKEKLEKAVGKDADGAEAGRAAEIFDEIDQNAGDYIALLLYQNRNFYFDAGAAIKHIAYAISGDLSFLGDELKFPKKLLKITDDLLQNYRKFGYVVGKKEKDVLLGIEFYYLFRISSSGKIFFKPIVERYKADTEKTDFVERLEIEPRAVTTPRATGPGSKTGGRPDP